MTEITRAQFEELHRVACTARVNTYHLITVISFETAGTFDPAKKAKRSSGIGLFQFMPDTLKETGLTSEGIARMTFDVQLNSVCLPYLRRWLPQGTPYLGDLYMCIFCPRARHLPGSAVLYKAPSNRYIDNRELDKEKKGYITKADCVDVLTPRLNALVAGGLGLW
jgi:hypothetical protein